MCVGTGEGGHKDAGAHRGNASDPLNLKLEAEVRSESWDMDLSP